MTKLAQVEAVLAVAKRGSFRAAAKALDLSASSVSQAVLALETELGVRLFHRTTRSVSLTAAGEQFVARARPALDDLQQALTAAADFSHRPTGALRVTLALGAARQIFEPIIVDYVRRYPEVEVELSTSDQLVDIVAERFDAGVRLLEAAPADMVAVPIGGNLRMTVVAAPEVIARHGRPKAPDDLQGLPCIGRRMAGGWIYRWEFERDGEARAVSVTGPLILSDSLLMRAAARQGLGFAYLSHFDVADDLAAGRLVEVLADWTPPYPGLALYYPTRRHKSAALQALIDLIGLHRA